MIPTRVVRGQVARTPVLSGAFFYHRFPSRQPLRGDTMKPHSLWVASFLGAVACSSQTTTNPGASTTGGTAGGTGSGSSGQSTSASSGSGVSTGTTASTSGSGGSTGSGVTGAGGASTSGSG